MRLIDADKIVEVAEHAWDEWNLAMATQDTNRGVNKVIKMKELCKAVKAVADDCPAVDLGEVYDLDRLRELVEADKDGRCVVLPCKTVFEPTWDAGPDCDGNCPHCFEPERCDICAKGKLFIYERTCTQEHISRFGKTVFRTRQEAEAACERLEKELKRLHEN